MDVLSAGQAVVPPGAVRAVAAADRPDLDPHRADPHRADMHHADPNQVDVHQTVRLTGTVDVRSVGELRIQLHAAIDAGCGPLHVDVGGLELTDNAGVGVLLGGARRARSIGRSLVLLDVPAALWPLLAADRLGQLLRVRSVHEPLVPDASRDTSPE
ncbi:anti-anti-sigma factor [Parafrankia irregularis]|uniref:Anti-anti-sigma factor n=1 Tax=Parafrankia irregularis TaxID=795642 RepID=A0A0S4QNB7_9ACTN|nr:MULTISPECIES: STAS domain-containing protein [Parafrankia]CUU56514.1 anti-anti-sigma factor [Parafrankia irregularis]